MVKNCYSPSRTGRYCWKQNFPPSKCKPKTYRSKKPREDVVLTFCKLKGTGKWAAQREGKLKHKNGTCPPPVCRPRRRKRR